MTDNLDIMGFDDLPSSRPTVPDGEYTVRLVGIKVKKSQKGSPYLSYDVVIQTGEHAGYRIFQGFMSLDKTNVWRFKAGLKAIDFKVPAGKTLEEAADYFKQNADGTDIVVQVGKRPAQAKGPDGAYHDVEGEFVNEVKRWVGPAD